MAQRPTLDARKAEMIRLMTQAIDGFLSTGSLTDADLDSMRAMDATQRRFLDALLPVLTEDQAEDAIVPLALVSLAVLFVRTCGFGPLTAMQILMSVFSFHSGIRVKLLCQDREGNIIDPQDGTQDDDRAGMSETTLRGAIDRLLRKRKSPDAPSGPTPTDAVTQQLVDELMAGMWDEKITVQ